MIQATDAHAHIFPDAIAHKAVQSISDFYGGFSYVADGTIAMLVENSRAAGVNRVFVHSVATSPRQVQSINNFIAANVKERNGMFVGFATMHPDFQDMAGELDRAKEMGLVGVKIHPDMQRFAIDDPRAMRLYGLMVERKMPLIAHTGDDRYDFSNPERTAHVLKAFPELKVQCAHFGAYSCWEKVFDLFAGLEAYTDTSSSFHAVNPQLAMRLIRFFGTDHVLFGSDYPVANAAHEREIVEALPLTEEEKKDVFYRAADRFLNPDIR